MTLQQFHALPQVDRLRQAQDILRRMRHHLLWVRADLAIVYARACWHLDNRVAELYQRFVWDAGLDEAA